METEESIMLPSEYVERKVIFLQRSMNEALGRSFIMAWRLLPVMLLVIMPVILTDVLFTGQLQGLNVIVITTVWLLTMKKAGMQVWVYAEVLQVFRR